MAQGRRNIVNLILAEEADNNNIQQLINNALEVAEPLNIFGDIEVRRHVPKNEDFYELTVPQYMDDLFIQHFRMSRVAVEELVQVIGATNPTQGRSIPLEKTVLFSLWILGKQECFLSAGDRFGFSKATGHKILKEFIAVVLTLLPQYVIWPDNHNAAIQDFHEKSRGFPGVIGAIDGCHVALKQPQNNPNDYYNRKQFHSVLLQGVCNHRLMFIDIFVGMPGRMHDARVFRNSEIYQRMIGENPLIQREMHLLGDSAYPITSNLLTPFRDNGHLTAEEVNYNQKLSSIRSVIERAFGRLKGKFRRLKYVDVADPTTATEMVAAACVLHNFIIIHDNDDEMFEHEDLPENPIDDNDEVELENRNVGVEKRRHIVNILRH